MTIVLRALGMTDEEMLELFFETNKFKLTTKKEIKLVLVPERLKGETAIFDIKARGKMVVEEGRRITARHVKMLTDASVKLLPCRLTICIGKILAHDVVDVDSGELLAKANDELTEELVEELLWKRVSRNSIRCMSMISIVGHTSPTRCALTQAAPRWRPW